MGLSARKAPLLIWKTRWARPLLRVIFSMEKIKGIVNHIIYYNKENGFTIMEVETREEDITVTGTFGGVESGEAVEIEGEYVDHPTYGYQFKASSFMVTVPEDRLTIRRYLESGAVKGVGKAIADRLIKRFGEDTLRIMQEEPERLTEIKGISERIARSIAVQMEEKYGLRSAIMFLQGYGISNSLCTKLYKSYGDRIYTVIKENPYLLAEDIRGVGFRAADAIAMKSGIAPGSEFRIRCGITHKLREAAAEMGHTCLPWHDLNEQCAELLEIPLDLIGVEISNMVMDKKLTVKQTAEGKMVYLERYYRMENHSAGMLMRLSNTGEESPESPGSIEKKLSKIEERLQINLDEIQREAVIKSIGHGVMVMSGGPGTGKTTTIKAIIEYFEGEGYSVVLGAPTGRAAKRMAQATGHEASTIHRMLQVTGNPEAGAEWQVFDRNEDNPIEGDVIIIDEMSMVDIHLFYSLLRAVEVGSRLIMVGDVDQLPSVGPGKVLRDIIESGEVPVVMLQKIFRQAKESDIVLNAHRINRGEPLPEGNASRDFFFQNAPRAEVIYKFMVQMITERLPSYLGVPPMEIQVLTPMRKGNLGVESLNKILQKYLNPPADSKREYQYRHYLFREGDKVMQTKNDYKAEWKVLDKFSIPVEKGLGVFNGDLGVVSSIDEAQGIMSVEFDGGHLVEYELGSLENLDLAYAITIHKSQGSEYPAVIMPLLSGPPTLMNRNLLYTGVTRGKSCVVILGSRETVSRMVENHIRQRRYSGLKERIMEVARS